MLTSPTVDPTDSTTIFALLYVRLACLELTGNITVAAQESKALEDLASDFYYFEIKLPSSEAEENIPDEERQSTYLEHIVPWELRVLTTRLQGIAFGDPRRGINGLYDLGMDARGHLSQQGLAKDERELWKARLADLGMRVVNALVEMDDLETARRTLASLKPSNQSNSFARMALLYLQLGDVDSARALCEQVQGGAGAILECLLIMAEGHYTEAVGAWKALLQARSGKDDEALITQNLAVCLLYCGMLNESRELLESLVDRGHSFQSLIYNLATIYELCSERSQFAMKTALTERVAQQTSSHETNWERPNIEFKI
ncbi:hypothetical protein KEM55_005632 [Ascosphaera atra]|nr:hypothetical protein KEM55_005632 [Ascosphaera atra]